MEYEFESFGKVGGWQVLPFAQCVRIHIEHGCELLSGRQILYWWWETSWVYLQSRLLKVAD